jgi:hypothetical protein
MKLEKKTQNLTTRGRAQAYASVGNFNRYVDTGDTKYLNDVHPRKGMKKCTEYYALGEGWEERHQR